METLPLFTPAPPAPVPARGAARPQPGDGGPAASGRGPGGAAARGAEEPVPLGAAPGGCGHACDEPGSGVARAGRADRSVDPDTGREAVGRTAGTVQGGCTAPSILRPAVAPPPRDLARRPAPSVPGAPERAAGRRPQAQTAEAGAAAADVHAAAADVHAAENDVHAAAAEPAAGPACPAGARSAVPAPEDLHPALWRAHQLGRQREATWSSGFAALDAALPGAGWPARVLTELLLPRPGIGEMRLLAPALAAVQRAARSVMLFDPPALPFGAALADCGIALDRLFVVRNREARRGRSNGPLPAADILWAVEQTLRSGHVGAVLAWLPPRLPAEALRRLQLAAQAHDGPAFVLREDGARSRPSVAPLRLWLCVAGADALRVHLLKRRGPPLAQPIVLALPPVLAAAARERARSPVAAPATRAAAPVPDTTPAGGPR